MQSDSTLRITDLREEDSAEYKIRFRTDQTTWEPTFPGTTLTVTGLQVKVTPATVTEGQKVTLTCSTTCTLGSPSAEETLTVTYGPKNTSVSVSPSGEIVEGSSVTLTCSSDANPPVDKYTWYKKNVTSPKASGQRYSITNIISEDRGEYYCEAQNGRGSMNSTALMIIVAGKQTSVLTAAVGITVLILVLILFLPCFMWFRRSTGGSDVTADTQSAHPDPNSDTYTALNMKTRSPEYDTLANVRDSSSDTVPQIDAEPSDYENCREPPHNLD
ncbi:junctional adhesion molecule A-like [Oncorhynchus tshawytscha]|uniref:junctional adhesion molecule A-like n=1 Tax=Oncorhynchus tshawytscha TaxID=74940 RepID=UPI001C3E58A0|nr:junctional adhesion molecule A-like [Oncorhynchus tshawytscha]